VVEQGMWRIRNKQELMELRKDTDVVAADRTAVRMEHGRVVKKYFRVKRGEKKNGKT
jgi:hypothetical protein